MISSRSIKRDAAPENAKPIKNATRAAVDARTRATCRSKASSAERLCEPSQNPSSWAATTPAIRPNATSSSVIRGPQSQSGFGTIDGYAWGPQPKERNARYWIAAGVARPGDHEDRQVSAARHIGIGNAGLPATLRRPCLIGPRTDGRDLVTEWSRSSICTGRLQPTLDVEQQPR